MNGERREVIGYDFAPVIISIGCSLIAVGMALPDKIGDSSLGWIRLGLMTFGASVAFVSIWLLKAQLQMDVDERQLQSDITRRQYGLAPKYHEEIKPVEPPAPVTVFTETDKGQFKIQRYPNPPSERFLQYIFDTADKKNRRIATEREATAFGKDAELWTSTDVKVWLNILDERGISKKGYESETDNAWRQLTDNATLEKALYDFGHSETPPTPLSVNPYVGHRV